MDDERKPTPDEAMGIAWWNSLDGQQREKWMASAGNTGVVADAWAAFKKGVDTEIQATGMDPVGLDAFTTRAMNIGHKKTSPN